MRFLFLLALSLFLMVPARANPESSPEWREAMTAYTAKDYKKASRDFQKIAEDEQQLSAALCHNVANSEYKLGELEAGAQHFVESMVHKATASMWYRRALALDPWLPEAKQNLRFLHNSLSYHRFESQGLAKFATWLPRTQWVAACQGAIWVTVLMIVWLVWLTPRRGRRWPLVTLLCLGVSSIVTAACGLAGKKLEKAPLSKRVVCIQSEAQIPDVESQKQPVQEWKLSLLAAPAEAAGTVITLSPGSELLPIKEEGHWLYCEVPVDKGDEPAVRGWLRKKTPGGQDITEPLWPWNATLVD